MKKLYEKSELMFALLWIMLYVLLSGEADVRSRALGLEKSLTAGVHLLMCAVLFVWIRRNGLSETYGLCRARVPAGRFLWYLPLALIASASLWCGCRLQSSPAETAMFVVSMLCVGFLEEIIFRGLLFRAMAKDNLKSAIVVSSLSFGLGHIVNLFNGSGRSLPDSVQQIVFAVMIGFILALIFCKSGSLIPCIVFHSLNNAISVFGAEAKDASVELLVNLTLIFLVGGGYLIWLLRIPPHLGETIDSE